MRILGFLPVSPLFLLCLNFIPQYSPFTKHSSSIFQNFIFSSSFFSPLFPFFLLFPAYHIPVFFISEIFSSFSLFLLFFFVILTFFFFVFPLFPIFCFPFCLFQSLLALQFLPFAPPFVPKVAPPLLSFVYLLKPPILYLLLPTLPLFS